jgi:hypothetical protein
MHVQVSGTIFGIRAVSLPCPGPITRTPIKAAHSISNAVYGTCTMEYLGPFINFVFMETGNGATKPYLGFPEPPVRKV